MKKHIAILLALSLSLCLIPSCGEEQTSSSQVASNPLFSESTVDTDTEDDFTDEINSVGNTSANLSNGGGFARQGKFFYFRNEDMSGFLTKMGTDLASPEILTSEVNLVKLINVVDQSIYFSSDNGGIYTVKTDKSGFKKLLDGNCIYLTSSESKLIYAISDETGVTSLYSSDLNGDNALLLKSSTGFTGNFAFEGGRIYYSFNEAETVTDYVCYISVDGSETGKAYTPYCEKFTVLNSKLYAYKDGILTVSSLSDSSDSFTVNCNIGFMNTDGNNLYFTDKDSGNMNKISLSDKAVTKLNSFSCSNIYLFGEHIFYTQVSSVNPSGKCIWRMRTDGTFDAKRVFAIF